MCVPPPLPQRGRGGLCVPPSPAAWERGVRGVRVKCALPPLLSPCRRVVELGNQLLRQPPFRRHQLMQQGLEKRLQRTHRRLLRLNPPIHRLQDAGDFALLGERWEGDGNAAIPL